MGGDSAGIARKHTYDAAGQLLETRRYFELGTTKEVWVAPVDRPPGDGRQGAVLATACRTESALVNFASEHTALLATSSILSP